MRKNVRQHELCQTRSSYRAMWDRRVRGEAPPPPRQSEGPQPAGQKPGPGTHLKGIFRELGFEACPICQGRAAQMDNWGAAGCREHFEEIVGWLRETAGRLGWAERFALVGRATASGWLLKVNWLDPIPSLVEEAIRRAERGG